MLSPRTISSRLLLCTLTLGACATVNAQASTGNSDAKARYEADVARCKAGQTNQDEATCLREAGAAQEEANRNRLTNKDSNFSQNQTDRCNSLPATERSDCMKQMSGANTSTSGSISSGGVLRETTITVPPGTPGSTTTTVPASPGVSPATPATTAPNAADSAVYGAPAAPALPSSPGTAPSGTSSGAPVPGTGLAQ